MFEICDPFLESLIFIWWKFDALITFPTYYAIFVVYQAK